MEGTGQDKSGRREEKYKGSWLLRALKFCLQRSWKWILAALIVLLVCCYCNRGHKLRLSLPEGFCATIRIKEIQDQGLGMGIPGFGVFLGGVRLDFELSNEYTLECLAVDSKGIMTIKQTYRDVQLEGLELAIRTLGGGYGKLNLDELFEEEIQEKIEDTGPVDLSLIMHVRPNGETIYVEEAEPFAERVLSGLVAPDDPNYFQIREHLIEWIQTKQIVGMPMWNYPPGRKIAGQIWDRKVDCSMPYLLGNRNIIEDGKIKFSKVVDGAARLEEDLDYKNETIISKWILGDRNDKGKAIIKSEGRRTGKIEIDLHTGLIKSGRIVARGELTQYPRMYDLRRDLGIYWITQTEIIEIETIYE